MCVGKEEMHDTMEALERRAVASVLLPISQHQFIKTQTLPGAEGNQAAHLVAGSRCGKRSLHKDFCLLRLHSCLAYNQR